MNIGDELASTLTKRELAAMMAMQALFSNPDVHGETEILAQHAVVAADTILKALEAKP